MEWTADKVPLFRERQSFADGDGYGASHFQLVPGFSAILRSDTMEPFHVPTDRYQPYQNAEFSELAHELAHETGGRSYVESMGAIKGGRVILALLYTGSFHVGIGEEDRNDNYCLLSSSHDGSRGVQIRHFTHRPGCLNVLSGPALASFRHTSGILQAIQEGLIGFAEALESGDRWRVQARALASRPMTYAEREAFFKAAHERAYGILPAIEGSEAEMMTAERKHAKARARIAAWVRNLEAPQQALGGNQGTAWSCLNAVTQYCDHEATVRRNGGTETAARLASNLIGRSSEVKSAALETALELVS
jgi:phage/plasmid-like protein (TIGR03299 family)